MPRLLTRVLLESQQRQLLPSGKFRLLEEAQLGVRVVHQRKLSMPLSSETALTED